ncbi:MAG: hypothetical protein BM560_08190 [Roseobacter sp. MedPE-SWde]|nr:MAG: hypothetical protein BM560_08190 [Roseobacter sp. MedPE-SWde]
MNKNFSKNLRSLCANHGSFAQICREIGINRQQFNRYVTGAGMPSAHNLRRIGTRFGLSDMDLMLDHEDFLARHTRVASPSKPKTDPTSKLVGLFQDQAKILRRFLGFYHVHFRTPAWPDQLVRSLIWLREQDGFVTTHAYERIINKDGSIRQCSRYSGLVTIRSNRIYLVEHVISGDSALSETVLFYPHRQQVNILKGRFLGVAARPRLSPYSSPVIWKRISSRVTAREALQATGVFSLKSDLIEPKIRNHIANSEIEGGPQSGM